MGTTMMGFPPAARPWRQPTRWTAPAQGRWRPRPPRPPAVRDGSPFISLETPRKPAPTPKKGKKRKKKKKARDKSDRNPSLTGAPLTRSLVHRSPAHWCTAHPLAASASPHAVLFSGSGVGVGGRGRGGGLAVNAVEAFVCNDCAGSFNAVEDGDFDHSATGLGDEEE